MAGSGPSGTNTAAAGSNVGIQAGYVSDSTVFLNSTLYYVAPGASPRERYVVGLRYLEDGVPVRARELISEAMARGLEDAEVRFHWVLAMLSKRAYRDLSVEERDGLAHAAEYLDRYEDDEWKAALGVVCELLGIQGAAGDSELTLKKLDGLNPHQREEIERHLDLVLTGVVKDGLWARTLAKAEQDRGGGDRAHRAWAYFQPVPAEARARKARPNATTTREWFVAVVRLGMFLAAFAYLGQLVIFLGRPLPTLDCFTVLAAMCVAVRTRFIWRYNSERLSVKELEHSAGGEPVTTRAREKGFVNKIDQAFSYYFGHPAYLPSGVEREEWLESTTGTRKTLRNEVVEIYRESRVSAGQVRWLVRFMIREVKESWESGTRFDYRKRYRTPRRTKVLCVVSLVLLVPAVMLVLGTALAADPFPALPAAIVSLRTGWTATRSWLKIFGEVRRRKEEEADAKQAAAARKLEFERWKARLDAIRPDEKEMEYWLYCDKTALLGQALGDHQLAWRDVVAHAFLQVPGRNCKRGRIALGPTRYSKYDIRLFLVTRGGVREIGGALDFEKVAFDKEEHENFRFDAVSSVRVVKPGAHSRVLDLTLTNGPTRSIRVTEPEPVPRNPARIRRNSSE